MNTAPEVHPTVAAGLNQFLTGAARTMGVSPSLFTNTAAGKPPTAAPSRREAVGSALLSAGPSGLSAEGLLRTITANNSQRAAAQAAAPIASPKTPALPSAPATSAPAGPRMPSQVPVPAGGFSGDQLQIAKTIEAQGKAAGASPKQILAAIETGITESTLRNLSYGDGTSTGVFQQTSGNGWGTPQQRVDPAAAAGMFFRSAQQVPNQDNLTAGELAQSVQRSAYPDRYDANQSQAEQVLQLTGYGPVQVHVNPQTGKKIAYVTKAG